MLQPEAAKARPLSYLSLAEFSFTNDQFDEFASLVAQSPSLHALNISGIEVRDAPSELVEWEGGLALHKVIELVDALSDNLRISRLVYDGFGRVDCPRGFALLRAL